MMVLGDGVIWGTKSNSGCRDTSMWGQVLRVQCKGVWDKPFKEGWNRRGLGDVRGRGPTIPPWKQR